MLLRPEVAEDELDFAPRDKLKKAVRRLEDNPEAGKPLQQALAGCRSLRLGGSENRIVYRIRQEASSDEQIVEVIAIGRRRDDEVYATAEGRL